MSSHPPAIMTDTEEEWVELVIKPQTHVKMFVNLVSGKICTSPPDGVKVKPVSENQWWELHDWATKQSYYYNAYTKETVWDRPGEGADIILQMGELSLRPQPPIGNPHPTYQLTPPTAGMRNPSPPETIGTAPLQPGSGLGGYGQYPQSGGGGDCSQLPPDDSYIYQQPAEVVAFKNVPVSLNIPAIAKYKYISTREDELSLEKGDEVIVMEKEADGWWRGRCGTQIGWFPFNYVEEQLGGGGGAVPISARENTFICGVRALYSFNSGNPEELPFRKGDLMDIIDQPADDPDWWEARKADGTTGLIPINYVAVVQDANSVIGETPGGNTEVVYREPSVHTDEESDANVLRKRQHVYMELLETERVYIQDLDVVLQGYYIEMSPEKNSTLPITLRNRRDVVFGNLPKIHKFHETEFIGALQGYEEHPERVGECFKAFMENFQMYSEYCKNRTQSEALINDTDNQAFFRGTQQNLGHNFSLDSYLLKPVQRITKYKLLLTEMMKYSVNAKKAHFILRTALEGILEILKNLNDSLHLAGIKGSPFTMEEHGKFLAHAPFEVKKFSTSHPHELSWFRKHHIFLYQRMVIITTKIETPVQKREKRSDTYRYIEHLPMDKICLRIASDDVPPYFELRIAEKFFRFKTESIDVLEMWASEIHGLLEAQFALIKKGKEQNIQRGSTAI